MRFAIALLLLLVASSTALSQDEKSYSPDKLAVIKKSCEAAIRKQFGHKGEFRFLSFYCHDRSKTHADIGCSGTFKAEESIRAGSFVVFVSSVPPFKAEAIVANGKTVYLDDPKQKK